MKNKFMRIAAVMLMLCLVTTCAISGTFAKYTTQETGTDTARVAQWGVNIDVDNFKLFAKEYEKAEGSFTGTYSVSSSDDDNLLAPGTSGTFAEIAISGTPEVAVAVKVASTVTISDNWMVDGDFYCPLVVTVGTTEIKGTTYDDAADFKAAIETAINGYSKDFAPKTDLSTIDANFDISWAWEFAGEDANDTKLGDKAVAEDLTFTIALTITVDQLN